MFFLNIILDEPCSSSNSIQITHINAEDDHVGYHVRSIPNCQLEATQETIQKPPEVVDPLPRKKRIPNPNRKPKVPPKWTEEEMSTALNALKSNMTLNGASVTYGIPKTTIAQRAKRMGIQLGIGRRSWIEKDMESAIDALRSKKITAIQASKSFGIPYDTLLKRLHQLGIKTARMEVQHIPTRKISLEEALIALNKSQTTDKLGTSVSANKIYPKQFTCYP